MEFSTCEDASSGLSPFDNPDLVVARNKLPVVRKTMSSDEDVQIVAPASQKRPRSGKAVRAKKILKAPKPDCEDEEKSKRNWTEPEIQALIALKGEMQPEFTKNAKKQGVDMWFRLHTIMVLLLPGFKKSPKACKNKFNDEFKQYKMDKLANGVSGESRHESKYYESFDTWYHQFGVVVKHVYAAANESDLFETGELKPEEQEQSPGTSRIKGKGIQAAEQSSSADLLLPTRKLALTSSKLKFHDQALELFSQMVQNSSGMLQSLAAFNALLERVDMHIEKLIEKL